jgi:GNAT superfamily N-acetyltransferase
MTPAPTRNPDAVEGRDYRLRPLASGDGPHSDVALVRNSWRRSYSEPWSDFATSPDLDTYIRAQVKAMDLALASSETLIACGVEHEDDILGWICFRRPNVLHYAFTKEAYRRHGLGRALFVAAFGADCKRVYATHVHTLTLPTRLIVRRDRNGEADYQHPVPAWHMFGARVNYQPWLVLL